MRARGLIVAVLILSMAAAGSAQAPDEPPDTIVLRSIRALRSTESSRWSGGVIGIWRLQEAGHWRADPALLRMLVDSLEVIGATHPGPRGGRTCSR